MLSARALTAPVLGASLVVLTGTPVAAGPPTDRLRELFAGINAVLADPTTEAHPLERVARIRRLVTDVVDTGAAAASALGAEWDTRTDAERDEFVTLFAELLERAYVGRLAGAVRSAGGVNMTYVDEVITGTDATVTTTLRGRRHDERVEYRMVWYGARWRVRDIVLDGVSTVGNYRAQFKRVLQQESYAALVVSMRGKLAEESLMFARAQVRPSAVTATTSTATAVTSPTAASPPHEKEDVVMAPPAKGVQPVAPKVAPRPRPSARLNATPIALPVVERSAGPAPVASSSAVPTLAPAVPTPPAVSTSTGRAADTGIWLAALGFVAGSGLIYLGWRAPRR